MTCDARLGMLGAEGGMRGVRASNASVFVGCAWLASAPVRADALPPPLFAVCFEEASVALDATIEAVDEERVGAAVHAVFVREGVYGGVYVAIGERFALDGTPCVDHVEPGPRAVLLLDDGLRCTRAFLADETGALELGKPDVVTTDEAAAAAVRDDCTTALMDAGYRPPPSESPLEAVFGCSAAGVATSATGATLGALLLLGGRGRRRRRGAPAPRATRDEEGA